jgi:hypothetical protein
MSRRVIAAAVLALPVVAWAAAPAGACGGLVGENGTIELVRTTTLAAYTDGVERYVTAFQFTGEGEEVGTIVPLPDVPTEVVRGGDWTLQRLSQEVAPPTRTQADAGADEASAASAEVVLETQIDALDITVLRGGGDEVGQWAVENGFLLTPDAPEVLDYYAERSPVFMAARFDAERARELGQGAGDSTPIMATIPTDDPWVPVRILSLGLEDSRTVEADVFLLTDDEPDLLAGGDGLTIDRSEPASDLLLSDLRSDTGMDWVPSDMWLSYLRLSAPASDLEYDLAVSTRPGVEPSAVDAGVTGEQAQARPTPVPRSDSAGGGGGVPWAATTAVGGALALVAAFVVTRRRGGRPAVAGLGPDAGMGAGVGAGSPVPPAPVLPGDPPGAGRPDGPPLRPGPDR